jgi:hypothetical protein
MVSGARSDKEKRRAVRSSFTIVRVVEFAE